jgi:hypothetical protein
MPALLLVARGTHSCYWGVCFYPYHARPERPQPERETLAGKWFALAVRNQTAKESPHPGNAPGADAKARCVIGMHRIDNDYAKPCLTADVALRA